jgi:pyruvate formate lyase activating enzyme
MSTQAGVKKASLEAADPFELRVDQGKGIAEPDVRAALKSGDMGFLHSFTTGSAVDGPGIRLVAWTSSCMFRCQYCHNPDTWTLSNGIPVTIEQAVDELRKYEHGPQGDEGRLHPFGRRAAHAASLCRPAVRRRKEARHPHRIETNGYYGDTCPMKSWG